MDLLGSGGNLFQEFLHIKLMAMNEKDMIIRRFQASDADPVSDLICRALREINSRDYPPDEIERLCQSYQSRDLVDLDRTSHFYVAEQNREPIGCAAIRRLGEKTGKILAVFVRPDMTGQQIGKALMANLAQDDWARHAHILKLDASETALGFYLKLGYRHAGDIQTPDSRGLYPLIRKISDA